MGLVEYLMTAGDPYNMSFPLYPVTTPIVIAPTTGAVTITSATSQRWAIQPQTCTTSNIILGPMILGHSFNSTWSFGGDTYFRYYNFSETTILGEEIHYSTSYEIELKVDYGGIKENTIIDSITPDTVTSFISRKIER